MNLCRGCCRENCWPWMLSAGRTEGPALVSWVVHRYRTMRRDEKITIFSFLLYRKTTGCALSCSVSTRDRATVWLTDPQPKARLAETDKWVPQPKRRAIRRANYIIHIVLYVVAIHNNGLDILCKRWPWFSFQHCTNGKCITEHENIIPDFSHNTPAYLRRSGDEGEATQDWPQYLTPNVTTQR